MGTPVVGPPCRPPRRRHAVALTAVLGTCGVLLLALVAARWPPLMELDGGLSRAAHRGAVDEPGLTRACRVLSDWVWDPWTMRLLCAAVAVWLLVRHAARWTAVWLVAVCALTGLAQQAVKAAVGRPRPVWPDPVDSAHYAAFPSGHALTATAVCGVLLWLLRHRGAGRALFRTALVLAVVSVVGVGATRVWLGVHWPSDVVGGWLLGALAAVLAVAAHRRHGP